jgi:hypothetical protein
VRYLVNYVISVIYDKLKYKKVVVFATGVSPSRENVKNEVRDKTLL